jgi:DNA-binding GntR family transcriptional regulator
MTRVLYGVAVIEFPEIDYRGETPPYQQIAAAIQAAIESGELRPRQPIPSEKELQDATGAGRTAVRNAVAWLRDHGFVYTVPQRGTYVSPR